MGVVDLLIQMLVRTCWKRRPTYSIFVSSHFGARVKILENGVMATHYLKKKYKLTECMQSFLFINHSFLTQHVAFIIVNCL